MIQCTHQSNVNSGRSLTISYLSTYGRDYCRILRQLEEEQGHDTNDLYVFLPAREQPHLTEEMRVSVVEWMSAAAFRLYLQDSTFLTAISLLDRVVAQRHDIEPYALDRIGVVCLLLSAKLIECPKDFEPMPRQFLDVVPVCMTVKDMIDLESDVCSWLCFRLHTITPLHFLDRFLLAADPKTHYVHAEQLRQLKDSDCCGPLECMVLYLLELATLRTDLASLKPDLLAAAALYLARATLNLRSGGDENIAPQDMDSEYWTYTLEYYTNYAATGLQDTVRMLHEMHSLACLEVNKWYAYEKFGCARYCSVSMIPVLHEEDLGFSMAS